MQIEQRIASLGYTLPEAPPKGGVYAQVKQFGEGGRLAYVSGCGPAIGETCPTGKLGENITFEQGRQAAENCILNILAVLKKHLGDLDKIKCCAKTLVFVASGNDFYQQPQVANAATELLVKIFGEEAGCPSRSAIGVNVLPGNIPVEVELLAELK